jgi:hypothetical protein
MTEIYQPPKIQHPVRYGVPEDVHHFMDLCVYCAEENGLTEFNTKKVLGEVWASLHHDHGIIGVIGEVGKPLEAGILLRIDTMPYSDMPVLTERAIFIHPEFRASKGSGVRGGRVGRLCEFAKTAADTLEVPLLIGILSSHRAASKVRLYERFFGEPAGAYWIYGAKTGTKEKAAEAAE